MNLLKNFGIKKQPFSFNSMSFKPASIPMQHQWSSMSKPEKIVNRIRFSDMDKDGVPNKWDCQPKNFFRQEFTPNRDASSEVTARRRFGHQNLQRLQKLGQGRDREVYTLDKDKVIKIARNPGGLTQNSKEVYLEELGQLKHYESGKDYVVMQKADRPGKATTEFLKPLKKAANVYDGNPYERTSKFLNSSQVQSTITDENEGMFADLPNYSSDFVPNELIAKRQWGEVEGKPVLIDAGALASPHELRRYTTKHFVQVANIDRSKPEPWQLKEWNEVQRERQQYRQPKVEKELDIDTTERPDVIQYFDNNVEQSHDDKIEEEPTYHELSNEKNDDWIQL